MNPYKRNDVVQFQGLRWEVKFVDIETDELFVQNHTGRKRVHYSEVSADF